MSIRLAVTADIPEILEVYGPYVEKTPYSFEYTVPTIEQFTQRFRDITRQFPWLIWEENGRILGYAYGSAPFDRAAYSWCAEASIYLRSEAHGRGIGTQLYRVLEYILKMQGYAKVYALIVASNQPSVSFHKALGYRQFAEFSDCGYKFGAWHSIIWMEKVLNYVEMPSNLPIAYHNIVNNEAKLWQILDILSLS